jgi:hypothetical protein
MDQGLATNNPNYADYRCIDPVAKNVGAPWYRIDDVCPCDPKLSFPTGRGFTSCPMGVQFDNKIINETMKSSEPIKMSDSFGAGSMFPQVNKQISSVTPPQLQPRPLSRIGQTWRSGW